eukprot:5052161-Pyramimonas_sp.AAC.1
MTSSCGSIMALTTLRTQLCAKLGKAGPTSYPTRERHGYGGVLLHRIHTSIGVQFDNVDATVSYPYKSSVYTVSKTMKRLIESTEGYTSYYLIVRVFEAYGVVDLKDAS